MARRTEQDRRKAAELFAQARRQEAQRDYRGARDSCKESLRLYEDKAVRAAYLELLVILGPL